MRRLIGCLAVAALLSAACTTASETGNDLGVDPSTSVPNLDPALRDGDATAPASSDPRSSTPADDSAAPSQRSEEVPPSSDLGPEASDTEIEREPYDPEPIELADAKQWWGSLGPILSSPAELPVGRAIETHVAKTERGWRVTDPRNDGGSISTLFLAQGSTVEPGSWSWVEAGGAMVSAVVYPRQGPAAPTYADAAEHAGVPVTVRGNAGTWNRFATSSVDLVMVNWREDAPDGTQIGWTAIIGTDQMSQDAFVAWIDQLVAAEG